MYSVNAFWRRTAVLMGVAVLLETTNAQQRVSGDHLTIFTASDSSFRFSYPSNFQFCKEGEIEPCIQSFIPACWPDALVCVVYPAKQFKDTSFGAASFQVREIHREKQMTPDVCVTPYTPMGPGGVSSGPEFLVSAEHPVEMIGGVQFSTRNQGRSCHGQFDQQ
jgi:hypothetical protein